MPNDQGTSERAPFVNKTIFLVSGSTFTFKNVSLILDNETVLSFNYTAMSDGRTKSVVFFKSGIAGHSTWRS